MRSLRIIFSISILSFSACRTLPAQRGPADLSAAAPPATPATKCTAIQPHPSFSKPLDIPQDNANLTRIAKGKAGAEELANPEIIYNYLQDHWRKKFEEKPKDVALHKANSIELIADISKVLGCPSPDALAQEFSEGSLKDMNLYTDESDNPFGAKESGKVPNYSIMNQALREIGGIDAIRAKSLQTAEMISKVDQVLAMLPPVKGLVFRGTSLSDKTLASIIRDGGMTDKGFLSTSINIEDAFDFLRKAPVGAGRARVLMTIYGHSGKFLPFGQFSKEEEVLFPHGTPLKLRHHFNFADPEDSSKVTTYLFFEES